MAEEIDSLGKEVEVVLVIVSVNPSEVAERIAGLESVGGYRLVQRPAVTMQDVYFDTADRILKKKRFNLRIRRVDNNYRITMKRNPGLFSLARNQRQELELPWSEDSLRKVLREFSGKGIRLDIPTIPNTVAPIDVLRGAGLSVIQSRETRREARDVTADGGRPVLAELVIDFVEYNFHPEKVGFYELEIEAKSAEGRVILEKIATALKEGFGEELRRWKYGKLMTGNAIRELLEKRELQGLVEKGVLTPDGFEKVRASLS